MKRFNLVVINHNKIDSFINNFNIKIKKFNINKDFITLLDSSPTLKDKIKFQRFCKNKNISFEIIKRNNSGLDHGARLEYFSNYLLNKQKFKYIFQFQENFLDSQPTKYDDGSQNFFIFKNKKIIKSDQLSEKIIFDLDNIEKKLKKFDIVTAETKKFCYFRIFNQEYIAPNGSNFIFRSDLLLDHQKLIIMNLILNELKFMGPSFSRQLISERQEMWSLWMELTWAILFFKNKKIYDINKNKIISITNKKKFYDYTKKYQELHKRFITFNKEPFVNRQRNKFVYYLKLFKQTFLLLYRGLKT